MTAAIRGAITVEENDREQIYEATSEMMQQIIELNNIKKEDIVSIVFTATNDLDKAYPGGVYIDEYTYLASGASVMAHDFCRCKRGASIHLQPIKEGVF